MSGAVLRFAWSILRRHATAFAVLALALAVAPTLLLHTVTAAVIRAMAPPVHTPEADLVAFVAYAAYMAGIALTHCLGFACDVAIVLVGLETDRASGRLTAQALSIVLRLIPVALATWIVGRLLFMWLPVPATLVAYAILNCWTVTLPVYAAERMPLRRLAGRSWAVFAKGGWGIVVVQAVYCVGEVGLNAVYLHLNDIFGWSGAANWAGRIALLSAAAVFGTVVAVVVIAFYRELRRVEQATPSPELVEAFD